MLVNKWQAAIAFVTILTAIIVVMLWMLSGSSAGAQELLTEAQALEKAIQEAQVAALQGTPIAYNARRMTHGEFAQLEGFKLGTDAAKVGLGPDVPVWVFSLRGDVVWRRAGGVPPPGVPTPSPEELEYSNILVVINAQNGKTMFVGAYRNEKDSPIPVPVAS